MVLLSWFETRPLQEHVRLMHDDLGHGWLTLKQLTENVDHLGLNLLGPITKLVNEHAKNHFFNLWLTREKFYCDVKGHLPEMFKVIF